jgi:hypothetical protein
MVRAGPRLRRVLGLPAEPGAAGTIMLALGIAAAVAFVLLARGRVAAELGVPLRSRVAVATVAVLATMLAAGPFVLWRVVEDIRYTSRLTSQQAEEVGAGRYGIDERVFARVRQLVPPDATYAVEAGPSIGERTRVALPFWAAFTLAPRVRVEDPRRAEWIVTWGLPPERLGVNTADETVIVTAARPFWYVARVVS